MPTMTTTDPAVTKVYSRVAGVYDAWTYFTESRSLRSAVDAADIRSGEAVLEVAVGTGVAFGEIVRRNRAGRNVGVDLSEGMLRRTRAKAARAGRSPSSFRRMRGRFRSRTARSIS
jgi:ubiquinone/menaquinone biosynthesis C-methylase UbiE